MVDRRTLERLLAPLMLRVRLIVARGLLRRSDDAGQARQLQAEFLTDELLDGVEQVEPYGFTARPLPGAEVLGLCIGGLRERMVAVVVADRRFRLTGLAEGEVALYTDEGDTLIFRRGREIEITSGGRVTVQAPEVVLDAATVRVTGTLQVDGALTAATVSDAVGSLGGLRTEYGVHIHVDDDGHPTGGPEAP